MITKISAVIPVNYKYNNISNSRNISFKGYTTVCEDIDICCENVDSSLSSMSGDIDITSSKINQPISTMSGDIDVEDSKIRGSISNMSGDIDVSSSNVSGNIKDLSGDIEISNNSVVNGNVTNETGSISLKESMLIGNASNTNGKVLLKDAIVEGSVYTTPEKIQLKGRNRVKELVLRGYKRAQVEYADSSMAELAKRGIFMKNNALVSVYGDNKMVISLGNINPSKVSLNKQLEFRLPKDSIIDTIRFDADKPGVLILDDGVEFLGKLINGIIYGRNNLRHVITKSPTIQIESEQPVKSADKRKRSRKRVNKPSDKTSSEVTKEASIDGEIKNQTVEAKKSSEHIMSEQCIPADKPIAEAGLKETKQERFPQLNWNEIPIESDATDLPSREIKYLSTFRDEELFDTVNDVLTTPKQLQYSVDDVPLRDGIWMRYSEPLSKYNQQWTVFYPELYSYDEIINSDAISSPWEKPKVDKLEETEFKTFMQYAREQIDSITHDYGMAKKIFKNCTVLRNGENKQDINLCKLALKLFKSSEQWGQVEEQILDEVRIPIYGKVFGAISRVKFKIANDMVYGYKNQTILNRLRNISMVDVFKLRSIL